MDYVLYSLTEGQTYSSRIMTHLMGMFTRCKNRRAVSLLIIVWHQKTVWKKMPRPGKSMMNPLLQVGIVDQLFQRIRIYENNTFLSAAMDRTQLKAQTQLIT